MMCNPHIQFKIYFESHSVFISYINNRDQDEEETEAGHFEKASEDEIRERK